MEREFTLTELSEALDYDPMATADSLKNLVEQGFMTYNPASDTWRLADEWIPRADELAEALAAEMAWREARSPFPADMTDRQIIIGTVSSLAIVIAAPTLLIIVALIILFN